MTLNIKATTKDVPSHKGRRTTEEIMAIRGFILESLEKGQTLVWAGGAAEDVKEGNTVRLRAQAARLNTERVEKGEPKFKMSVGADGDDLYFRATAKSADDSEHEPAADAEPETPKGRKAKATAGAK